jgi:hypothetical protein
LSIARAEPDIFILLFQVCFVFVKWWITAQASYSGLQDLNGSSTVLSF